MRSYTIALFLIVIGAFYGFVGEMYSTDLPGSDLAPESSYIDAEHLTESTQASTVELVTGLPGLLHSAASIMMSGILTALAFSYFLNELGVPWELAIALNAPVWFIYLWDIIPWVLNRSRGES